jgi:hypothetical protein
MEIKGIATSIVDRLVDKTVELGQGRIAGLIGFINSEGYIDSASEMVFGEGVSLRKVLSKISTEDNLTLFELINLLPENAVLVKTDPGSTGIIEHPTGVDLLNIPIVKIGVKMGRKSGIGVVYPDGRIFDLISHEEDLELKKLMVETMEEEHALVQEIYNLGHDFLEFYQKLPEVDIPERVFDLNKIKASLRVDTIEINSIDEALVEELVKRSMEIEQGVEVGTIAKVVDGHVIKAGEIVIGGIGYVPSRKLSSSYTNITGISTFEVYSKKIPLETVIVHTHPGGTGVMHSGDAENGPDLFGRPIIAIGHDQKGKIKGATVIEVSSKIAKLDEEYSYANDMYSEAETVDEEIKYRNMMHDIDKEYTKLSKAIKIL